MDYQFPKKQYNISNSTKDKVEACKRYIERKYAEFIKQEQEKMNDWDKLQQKMNELNVKRINSLIKPLISRNSKTLFFIRRPNYQGRSKYNPYVRRTPTTTSDFEPIAIIGRGAFGEVRVCRYKKTGEIVAVKKMKKSEMLAKNQLAHIRAERDILAQSNVWTVDLKQAFQDDKHLYLVMEYMVGGDLMTLLMKKDILMEEEAKFYIAELVLAVDSIHKMNYIHRDLKPDNILIDRKGHLKLSDFGLCKYTEIKPKIDFGKPNAVVKPILSKVSRKRVLALSTVGTPDYIAPEVFSQTGYSEIVDWWSVGVMLFEMVVGYPPFFSDDPQTTCQKILNWQQTFQIPTDMNLSPTCIDLIRRLMAEPHERLGINGVQEIKIHPFFQGIDWKKIRDRPTPYVPPVSNDIDTQNFEKFEEEEPWLYGNRRVNKDYFQGYSFNKQTNIQQSPVRVALEEIEHIQFQKPHSPAASHRRMIDPKKQVGYLYNQNQGARSNSPPNNGKITTPRGSQVQQQTLIKILTLCQKKDLNMSTSSLNNYNSKQLPNLSIKKPVRNASPKYYYQ